MAILDRIFGVGEAVREKVRDTFSGRAESEDLDTASAALVVQPALDASAAYAFLGLKEGANLADVRDAYRTKARQSHARAARDGVHSDAQRDLDRLLEALELLEEQLVPLAPTSRGSTQSQPPPGPGRKRATARKQ